jgi:hypothetical protein
MIIRFILFGMLGIVAMVLITAVKSSVVNRRLELTGEASLVHFPLFGIIALIYPIIAIHIGFLPWSRAVFGGAFAYQDWNLSLEVFQRLVSRSDPHRRCSGVVCCRAIGGVDISLRKDDRQCHNLWPIDVRVPLQPHTPQIS